MSRTVVETRRDRLALAQDAGVGRVSPLSVLAGVMTAYGTFVLVLGVTAAVLRLAGINTDYSANDWRRIGTGAGLVVAVVLFVSYLFGGYVAGRMARRSGTLHGLLVFVVGLLLLGGAAVLANAATDHDAILRNLRSVGIPTTSSEWRDAGTIAGIASLAAMLLGSLLGGLDGERWHGKLLARALDPTIGTEAALRRRHDDVEEAVERQHGGAERRVVSSRGTTRMARADTDGDGDDEVVEERPRHRWSLLRR